MRRQRILCAYINIVKNFEHYLDELVAVYHDCREHELSLVKYHSMRMGKQDFCFVDFKGSKFWVWQYPMWSVYVSNKRGINFHVVPELNEEEAKQAFNNYLQLVS